MMMMLMVFLDVADSGMYDVRIRIGICFDLWVLSQMPRIVSEFLMKR